MTQVKAKIIPIVLGSICVAGISVATFAANGYAGSNDSSVTTSVGGNGYTSTASTSSSGGANGYSSGGQGSNRTANYPSQNGHHYHLWHQRFFGYFWFQTFTGGPFPPFAVAGGTEHGHPLFVCRGHFHGGIHPGKIVDNTCHISWGGNEIALPQYQVLVSPARLHWVPGSHGFVPKKAIKGGYEPNRNLYICQANYNGGIHPGKIVGQVCDIAWGGKEISLPQYKVLVR